MAAGYSGTPLAKKLGLKPGHVVAVVHEPDTFRKTFAPVPDGHYLRSTLRGSPDVAVFFVTRRSELARRLPATGRAVFPEGMIWIAWPKKASKVPTDVTEDSVREIALALGLVDVKVCAIDDVWSGLKVVWRRFNPR